MIKCMLTNGNILDFDGRCNTFRAMKECSEIVIFEESKGRILSFLAAVPVKNIECIYKELGGDKNEL